MRVERFEAMTRAVLAVIGLGSNLGQRLATLRAARLALAETSELVRASRVYETVPIGPTQPAYLNAALLLRSPLGPLDLLARSLEIEREHGRVRRERWGPRTLDLDLLWTEVGHRSEQLEVPHPRLCDRAFALRPLLDVLQSSGVASAPTLAHYSAALARVGMLGVEAIAVTSEWHRISSPGPEVAN